MDCLDPNAVQDYLKSPATASVRARVDVHLDTCDDCRALVALAAELLGPPDPDAEVAAIGELELEIDTRLRTGARVSRYRLGERLGSGAMGVVYAADDPELHRRIAIKLLHAHAPTAGRETRLLREAQALARVSDPHVISVFDVGTHDGQVFLAMELVDGTDLRSWLAERPRRTTEIVEAFVAAGRGLAAAHAAGLVHRDFKPQNVLVGSDGRVRVTDFGLARGSLDVIRVPSSAPSAAPSSDDLLAIELTHGRALVGTPAYMAPEQLAGGAADAASDQFSFCVTLYEALYGHRPFVARSLPELRHAVLAGRVRDEPHSPVPQALRRILLRGLAVAPDDRFASMTALVAALTSDHARAPRRALAVAVAGIILIAALLVGDFIMRSRADSDTRGELGAASEQLDRALKLRYQAFAALTKPTSALPVIREVAGNVDKAEFGLGEARDDRGRLRELHENLASADWRMWMPEGTIAVAVADYKGRLIYSSGAPAVYGTPLALLEAVARAFDPENPGIAAMIVGGDDPLLLASGLFAAPQPGLVVVFARTAVPGGVTRAVFVQAFSGARLLQDLSLGAGNRLSLVNLAILAEGTVPIAVAAAALAAPDEVQEVHASGAWLALAHPIGTPDDPAPVATMVIARAVDAGIERVVPHARVAVAIVAAALLILGFVAGGQGPGVHAPTIFCAAKTKLGVLVQDRATAIRLCRRGLGLGALDQLKRRFTFGLGLIVRHFRHSHVHDRVEGCL